jgi:putative DNA primase/helicase
VPRLGWHEGVFVLPEETIGSSQGERVIWHGDSVSEHPFKQVGSGGQWRSEIGVNCSGNTRLLFAVSCAVAAPLLSILGEESIGFHFRGPSSQGKTTALRVAGSVWGGGGRNGYVESWLTTMNGLEAIAEMHNDGLLCLDELAQVDPVTAGDTAYLLANGQGKGRMNKCIAAQRRLKWSLCFLSSGEVSLQAHVKSAGKVTRAGQHVRMGLFEDIHDHRSADSFARFLSEATLKYYGTPIREFLYRLIHVWGIHSCPDCRDYILEQRAEFVRTNCPDGASGEVSRVAGHFALVAAAGELATMMGITGWTEGETTAAAAACFQSWLKCRGTGGSSDEEMAVTQVRAFMEAHGSSRFQDGETPVVDRVGFRRKGKGGVTEYWVLPEAFHGEVCKGFDPTMVAKVLADRGYLRRSGDRIQVKERLPGIGLAGVYIIRETIFT